MNGGDLRRDQSIQRHRVNGCIGINHEHVLVERRVDTDDVLDLVVDLKLEWVHWRVEVDLTVLQQLSMRAITHR